MGTIKRYLFRRTLRTDVAWDFVTRTLMVKLLYTL
jgi:hypothetical protein